MVIFFLIYFYVSLKWSKRTLILVLFLSCGDTRLARSKRPATRLECCQFIWLDKGGLVLLLSSDWFRHILARSSGLANEHQGVYFSPIFGIFLMELAQRFLTAIYLLHFIVLSSVWSYHLPNILTLLIYPSFSFEPQLNWKACLLTYSIDTGIHSKYLFSSLKAL